MSNEQPGAEPDVAMVERVAQALADDPTYCSTWGMHVRRARAAIAAMQPELAARYQDGLFAGLGPEREAREAAAREAGRREGVTQMADAAMSAALRATYGPPSGWGAPNPPGWHLNTPCTPELASHHDNGVINASRAIRVAERALAQPATPDSREGW